MVKQALEAYKGAGKVAETCQTVGKSKKKKVDCLLPLGVIK